MRRSRARRPIAVFLCVAASIVFAFPTLALPADSSSASKAVYVVFGSALLIAGMARLRLEITEKRESRADGDGPHPSRGGHRGGETPIEDDGDGFGGDVPHG